MSSRPSLPVLLGFFSAWGLVGALAFAFLLVPGLGPGEEAGGESIITTYYYNQVPAPLVTHWCVPVPGVGWGSASTPAPQ